MADGRVLIDTAMDETGVDKGIVSIDKKLKTGTKNIGGLTSGLAKASIAGAGVAVALKKAAEVIGDLTDAYKKQAKAETQLESAAKNNPYLTDSSVKALKDYASELQNISTVGDEELLPQMASLAAAGRTQDEIMQIMSASLDMAASGSFTLDSAVRNLNKAYGGLSGELGESIPEIKALTAEQLKNGAATKLMAERYKGIAAETAKVTGSSDQMKNAIGDAKEEIGYGWEKSLAPFRRFITEVVGGWAAAKKARREYDEGIQDAKAGELTVSGTTFAVEAAREQVDILERILKSEQSLGNYAAQNRMTIDEARKSLEARLKPLKDELELMKSREIIAREKGRADDAEAKRLERLKKESKDYANYISEATAARDKAIESIKLQAAAEGVEVDEMDILNANMSAYVSLISESNGLVTANSAIAREWLATTREQAEALAIKNSEMERAATLEGEMREALSAIQGTDDRSESQKMRDQMKELNDIYNQVISNEQISADQKLLIWQEYEQKKAQLEKNITETEKEELAAREQANRDQNVKIAEIANEFASQYQTIMSSITTLANQMIEDEATLKLAKLEDQYEAGKISAEKYEDERVKIEKKAAKEKYKVAMWQWAADIATATANIALGMTQALAQGGYFGTIMAAMVGAAGAVQLAQLISNKPIPPSFTTGGIIGGTSYTGDENLARLNSREMILNAGQQRNLFDRINSGDLGSSPNIKIYNSAANDVNARANVTRDGVEILIKKTVARDMANGEFNQSYKTMQNQINGVRYTN